MSKKSVLFAIIASLCILISGCGNAVSDDTSGLELISQFCVKLLLKYDASDHSRLLDTESVLKALDEDEQVSDDLAIIDANANAAKKPTLPESAGLDAECISQLPELPNGCEVTSLTMCLNYKGYEADKCDIADNYLPKTSKWEDLNGGEEAFLGNPRSDENGWYCFAGCICKTIDNFNDANDLNITYKNLTGSEPEALYTEVANGNPCIIWGTIGWEEPEYWSGEVYPSIEGYYYNLHCMVLSGYTSETVTIEDPLYGETTIDKETFEDIFAKIGSRAVVIY